jgi:hypothetical protein
MNKRMIIVTLGLLLGTALTAHAQTATDSQMYLNIYGGGQLQSRDFSSNATFSLYNETGTVTANQTIGSGFVFDASYGYRITGSFFVAGGVSTFNGSGNAAAVAAIPSPLFVGKPTIVPYGPDAFGDLKQTDVSINITAVWMHPLSDRLDITGFAGPSIIHVSQEIASITGTAAATPTVEKQSKVTAKAGSAGIDLTYKVNPRYSVGGFVRYLGGEVDLPAVANMKIGGAQAGGGIRIRF